MSKVKSSRPTTKPAGTTPTVTDQLRAMIQHEIDSGTTLNALAVAAGIPYPRLWQFVNGYDIRLATADKLCGYFGVRLTMR